MTVDLDAADTAPVEDEGHVWTLTPDELEATRKRFDKINRRAARRGFAGRLELHAEQTERTYRTHGGEGFEVTEIVYKVRITGEAPRYNGWSLLATLDWDPHAGLVVRTAPGVTSVDRGDLREGWCDHCQTTRHRKNTYLVGNDDGRQVQVGSTCLRDFLGWDGRPVFICPDDVAEEIGFGSFGGGPRSFTVLTVLATAWAVIKHHGYVRSRETGATVQVVGALLDPRNEYDRKAVREYAPYIQDAAAMGELIRDFILSDEFSGHGEYVINLKAVAGAHLVTGRNLGLLVSAPQAWAKTQERTLIRERERAALVNEHYGTVKQRVELRVRITSVRAGNDNGFGAPAIYTLVSEDGHVFKWFSSQWALGETPTGEEYLALRGTVKAHGEWQGQKETVLTRCTRTN